VQVLLTQQTSSLVRFRNSNGAEHTGWMPSASLAERDHLERSLGRAGLLALQLLAAFGDLAPFAPLLPPLRAVPRLCPHRPAR